MKNTVIFIIGAGHSGSTILSKALNAHSSIFALGEISNFEEDYKKDMSLCGCATPIRECPFWEKVNGELRKNIGFGIKDQPRAFNLKKERNSLFDKALFWFQRNLAVNFNIKTNHYSDRLKNIHQLFETIFNLTRSEALVDSSKSPKRALLLKNYFKKFYNIKIVHLVRDGRAVFYSYSKGYYQVKMRNSETGEQETKTFYTDGKRAKEEILKIWQKANKSAFIYHKNIMKNKNYFFMRYEDFANQPEKYLKRLLQFIELEYEQEMLDLNRFENHMVCGNASRINAEKILKPFNSWKEKLTQDKLDYFNKYGRRFNKKLGYYN